MRSACLHNPADMPSTLEYMNRDAFDVVDRAGRMMCAAIGWFGIGPRLRQLWGVKLAVEAFPLPYFDRLPDKILYWFNAVTPQRLLLPAALMESGKQYDHHVIVQVDDYGDGGYARLMGRLEAVANANASAMRVHVLSAPEAAMVKTFRFAAAPAFRTYCVGKGLIGISLDYALPLNYQQIPTLRSSPSETRMRYSHFGCAVVHEDIAYRHLERDVHEEKLLLKSSVESLGGGPISLAFPSLFPAAFVFTTRFYAANHHATNAAPRSASRRARPWRGIRSSSGSQTAAEADGPHQHIQPGRWGGLHAAALRAAQS